MLTDILLLVIVILLAAIFYLLSIAVKRLVLNSKSDAVGSESIAMISVFDRADKYTRNGISEAVAKGYKDIIIEKMEVGEPYINPDFKLNDLAKLISLSKHQTSLVLNQELKMDFNSFVNSFRIKKAIRLLSERRKIQIGEVMYEVGFNNSTTFNRAFKKFTGMTPKGFIIENRNSGLMGRTGT